MNGALKSLLNDCKISIIERVKLVKNNLIILLIIVYLFDHVNENVDTFLKEKALYLFGLLRLI